MRLTIFVLMAAAILLAGCDANPFGGNGMDWTFEQHGHESPSGGSGDVVVAFNPDGSLESVKPGGGVANVIVITTASQSDGGTDILGGEADVDASPLSSPSESASESGN